MLLLLLEPFPNLCARVWAVGVIMLGMRYGLYGAMPSCCVCARVWAVRYNQFHDQLVLTSSSDFRVILNRLVTLSSEPSGHFLDDDQEDSDCPNNSEGAYVPVFTVQLTFSATLQWRLLCLFMSVVTTMAIHLADRLLMSVCAHITA